MKGIILAGGSGTTVSPDKSDFQADHAGVR